MKNQIINNDLKIFTKKFNKFFKTKLGKDKNLLNKAMLYSINSGDLGLIWYILLERN